MSSSLQYLGVLKWVETDLGKEPLAWKVTGGHWRDLEGDLIGVS